MRSFGSRALGIEMVLPRRSREYFALPGNAKALGV